MPLQECEAIVLRSFPLGEADRVVSLLTRPTGRLKGVAKGARRTKSRFGATLEFFSHIRVWYFERETRELVRINQCELLESFLDAQQDYACGVGLALVSEITEAVLPEREASDAAFRLVLLTARNIQQTRSVTLPLAYFSLWMVRLAGWLPELDRCGRCGKTLEGLEAYASLVPGARRGLACRACRVAGMRKLSSKSLGAARRMLDERLERLSQADTPDADLTEFLWDIVEQEIERKLAARPLLAACG